MDSKKLEQAVEQITFGQKVQDSDIQIVTNGDDAMVSKRSSARNRTLPPNPEFVKMALLNRIGGPQDWC